MTILSFGPIVHRFVLLAWGMDIRYYWAGFLSWPFICGSFAEHTMPPWNVQRLCFTVSYVVTMLMIYVLIHKVLHVHHSACLYHSWQCAHFKIAPNYLSKLRNSSYFSPILVFLMIIFVFHIQVLCICNHPLVYRSEHWNNRVPSVVWIHTKCHCWKLCFFFFSNLSMKSEFSASPNPAWII